MDQFLASVERRAYRIAQIAVGNSEDALDLVQDAMFGLVQRYGSKSESEWGALFHRILQSRIRDWYRRNKVRNHWRVWRDRYRKQDEEESNNAVENLADPAGRDPSEQLEGQDSIHALETALQSLPYRQQQAFLLRTWEGMSVAETAYAMGCSQGSVKTHYSRAVHAMRELLEDHWP
jgi:RNA polymerase sigma-70 factor (ECF subfamily)